MKLFLTVLSIILTWSLACCFELVLTRFPGIEGFYFQLLSIPDEAIQEHQDLDWFQTYQSEDSAVFCERLFRSKLFITEGDDIITRLRDNSVNTEDLDSGDMRTIDAMVGTRSVRISAFICYVESEIIWYISSGFIELYFFVFAKPQESSPIQLVALAEYSSRRDPGFQLLDTFAKYYMTELQSAERHNTLQMTKRRFNSLNNSQRFRLCGLTAGTIGRKWFGDPDEEPEPEPPMSVYEITQYEHNRTQMSILWLNVVYPQYTPASPISCRIKEIGNQPPESDDFSIIIDPGDNESVFEATFRDTGGNVIFACRSTEVSLFQKLDIENYEAGYTSD